MNELFNNLSGTIEKCKCALFQTVSDPDLTNSWCSAKRKAPLIVYRLSLLHTYTLVPHTADKQEMEMMEHNLSLTTWVKHERK